MENNTAANPRRHAMPLAAALTLGISMVIAAPPARAAGPVVEVGPNLLQSILNQINTLTSQIEAAGEYAQNATRWIATLNEWRDRLAQYQQIVASPLMPTSVNLTVIPEDWNVAERCGVSGLSLGGIMSALNLNLAGDIGEQQKNICMAIQLLENRKYNETVTVVRDTMPQVQGILDKIKQIRLASRKAGTMPESSNNTLQSFAAMDKSFKAWESQIRTYDLQIGTLRNMQQILAGRALKGERNPIGTLVKTATLKAALEL
ncbi:MULTISPECIES: hypothetical protein [Stenotrophomonas]|nr:MULTISPECIES: hypothetical protein [Stenotrophomonas]MCG8277017.1 hypothetical protein [Stenotrophomonas sp. NLF4-10]